MNVKLLLQTFITRKAVSNGISKDKLVVGLSVWGRSYILNNVELREAGAPSKEWGYPGEFTDKRGKVAYFEVTNLFGFFYVHVN